ncbi:MAG: hypothetical protein K8S16_11090 [Bacteroidales bacterium]|nr:hypothetical protein [Bacteroidales bacterium]
MKKLMHILFLSCLKATELIEKKMHFKLSIREKMQLRIHKSMCNACSNYEKQDFLIEMGIARQENIETNKTEIDIDIFKKSILDKIEK